MSVYYLYNENKKYRILLTHKNYQWSKKIAKFQNQKLDSIIRLEYVEIFNYLKNKVFSVIDIT